MTTPASGGSHDIKLNTVPADSADVQGMRYQEIMQNLHALKPGAVTGAADSFRHLGDVLEEIRVSLAQTATKMAPYWTGTAAQAAMDHFQRLHDQAAQLSAEAYTASNTTTWVGRDVMPQFQAIEDPQVMSKTEQDAIIGSAVGPPGLGTLAGAGLGKMGVGHDGTAKADKAAQEYQATFDQHMARANAAMPSSLTSPPKSNTGDNPWSSSGSGSGSSSSSAVGSGHGGGLPSGGSGGYAETGTYSPVGTAHTSTVGLPSGNGDTVGSLAGYTPSAGVGVTPPVGAGAAGGLPGAGTGVGGFGGIGVPGGGFDSSGYGRGVSPAAEAEEDMAEESLGTASKATAADEAGAAEAAGAEAAAARAAGSSEGGMSPGMGGVGGGQQEKERQRRVWMNEDADIWGGPQDVVSPVLE